MGDDYALDQQAVDLILAADKAGLVVEGIPVAQRGPGGFEYARVLEVHPGPGCVQPLASLSCKMDPTV